MYLSLSYAQHALTIRQPIPLLPGSALVECKFLTLKYVSITPTTLTGPRGDDSIHTTSLKLPLQCRLDLARFLHTLGLLPNHALALLDLLFLLLLPPPTNTDTVMCLKPLPEGRRIDLHDGTLRQGIRTHELVVRRVVHDANDTGLAGDAFAAPGEVAGVETQGAELAVAAAGAHEVDSLGTDTGVGRLAAFLECSEGCR